jgi:hypothetical protein
MSQALTSVTLFGAPSIEVLNVSRLRKGSELQIYLDMRPQDISLNVEWITHVSSVDKDKKITETNDD